MIKRKKPKRKCRKCKKPLPLTRYFNCNRCQPHLPEDDVLNYYGGFTDDTKTTSELIRRLNT